jgi:hypothetical protein
MFHPCPPVQTFFISTDQIQNGVTLRSKFREIAPQLRTGPIGERGAFCQAAQFGDGVLEFLYPENWLKVPKELQFKWSIDYLTLLARATLVQTGYDSHDAKWYAEYRYEVITL